MEPNKEAGCQCEACAPNTLGSVRMIVCQKCGNKRCPHATDHRNECTNRNEVGQKGSSWEHVKPFAAPPVQQEPFAWFNTKYSIAETHKQMAAQLGDLHSIQSSPAFKAGELVPLYTHPAPDDQTVRDAARYEWLRENNWSDGPDTLCVTQAKAVKLGHDAPSGERLDAAIDAVMPAAKKG